ncbi:MAG: hypothetical protein J5U17_01600 [Candidatus Methanoperedens sp.]|nr:hypothetical protein [Candidatus Methanoperedens sp.]MCE8426990.1 hypothetical protein [Candidatus Methanoperedens sp.]
MSAVKNEIQKAARSGIRWLKLQKPDSIKDLSRSIQALSLWKEDASRQIELLLSLRKNGYWMTDRPIPDTARACIALYSGGIIDSDYVRWIQEQQINGNWNNNEIDTSYGLIALSDHGIRNEAGCEWLLNNYGEKWEHVGTTSLIITALIRQDKDAYRFFIEDRAGWILSKRLFRGWTFISTSNLAIQGLMLAGERDLEKEISLSIKWLLEKQTKDNWGDITSTSLSLISLKMYLDII